MQGSCYERKAGTEDVSRQTIKFDVKQSRAGP